MSESLAQALGVIDPQKGATPEADPSWETLEGKAFCEAVVKSPDFRTYIVLGLRLGNLPAAVLCRVLDHAWGKPPDKVELTGKDGKPIEHVTEVRRTIVHVIEDRRQLPESEQIQAEVIDGEVRH